MGEDCSGMREGGLEGGPRIVPGLEAKVSGWVRSLVFWADTTSTAHVDQTWVQLCWEPS